MIRNSIQRTAVGRLVWLVPILCLACTGNPFFRDRISPEGTEIRGRISLDDGSSPYGAFVWLEGANVGTYADSSGRYVLTLPPAAETTNLSGVFNVYFFLANYRLQRARVVLRNGKFLYNQADLSASGDLLPRNMVLRKFLHIRIYVDPESIIESYDGYILFAVSLQPASPLDTITVVFPGLGDEEIARIFARNVETGEIRLLMTDMFSIQTPGSIQRIQGKALALGMKFRWSSGFLPTGTYEFMPYMIIQHDPVPPGLLRSLKFSHDRLEETLLRIPLRVKSAKLAVAPPA